MKTFWISLLIFLVCGNALTATVLFDLGGVGMFDFRPALKCFFYGGMMLLSGFTAVGCRLFVEPTIPRIPDALRYSVGYLTGLGFLSVLVLVMCFFRMFDRDSILHLPFWGYVILLALLYPICGYFIGRKLHGQWHDLLWGVIITVILCGICQSLIHQVDMEYAQMSVYFIENFSYRSYTQKLLYQDPGKILWYINLPACVLMKQYEYAYIYTQKGGFHDIPRDLMAYLVCACPPILFSLGWGIAVIREKFSKKSEKRRQSMIKLLSSILILSFTITAVSCSHTPVNHPDETTADTMQTETASVDTTEPMETEVAATETFPVTDPTAETDTVTPPVGYGSEVTAFNSIREMIEKINNGDLSAGDQKIFDAYGCDTAQLLELTGMDEGFSELSVEWCGGLNYCINYGKDGQIIAFDPYYTDEQFNSALSGLESWDNLLKNELLLNLEKTDLPTDEGFMYECTFDTAVVTGQRKTYHEFTGTDGIQRIVTNWYGADGNPISGQIYILDGHVPFSCYVFGFEADMELAKRLGTKHVLNENTAAENPALLELHSQNEDQDFGFTVRVVDGVFEKSNRLTLDVTMTNQMDTAYTWTGSSSSFFPWMEFVCVTENGDFVIQPEPILLTADVENNSVAPGEHDTRRFYFEIPYDAPDGVYSLICSFQSTTY